MEQQRQSGENIPTFWRTSQGYSHRAVHWFLASRSVDLCQQERRAHRLESPRYSLPNYRWSIGLLRSEYPPSNCPHHITHPAKSKFVAIALGSPKQIISIVVIPFSKPSRSKPRRGSGAESAGHQKRGGRNGTQTHLGRTEDASWTGRGRFPE